MESFCGDFTDWRMLAALLFLSRGAPAARTLLTAAGSLSEIPLGQYPGQSRP
ncbi:hypothetical protein CM1200mP19_0050 [bacterium]|nr:MAG: hypothetical protein CM1200mP19_0050 [bacterium]